MFEMFTSLTMIFSLCHNLGSEGRTFCAGSQNLRTSDALFLDYLVEKLTGGIIGFERNFMTGLFEVGVGDGEHWLSPF